jgi:hypothetical protein
LVAFTVDAVDVVAATEFAVDVRRFFGTVAGGGINDALSRRGDTGGGGGMAAACTALELSSSLRGRFFCA